MVVNQKVGGSETKKEESEEREGREGKAGSCVLLLELICLLNANQYPGSIFVNEVKHH